MPDSRNHRGAHPEDARDFAAAQAPRLRAAARELSYLFGHDYALDAALKLVRDHHQLSARQRKAVQRASCADSVAVQRATRRVSREQLAGQKLALAG